MKSYSESMAAEGENAFSPGTSSLLYRVTGNQTYRCAYEQQKKQTQKSYVYVYVHSNNYFETVIDVRASVTDNPGKNTELWRLSISSYLWRIVKEQEITANTDAKTRK